MTSDDQSLTVTAPASPESGADERSGTRTTSELQPIRDRDNVTVGYEIFYRHSAEAEAASERSTAATRSVLHSLAAPHAVDLGPGSLFLFVNVTRPFLVGLEELPGSSEVAVLEVQPETQADQEVVDGVSNLRNLGYGVALDRYFPGADNGHDALLPYASHVKLDVDGMDAETMRHVVEHVRRHSDAFIIACRISTEELYQRAWHVGCDQFQGRAVDLGERLRLREIERTLTGCLRVLATLQGPPEKVKFSVAARAVINEPELAGRVLRACNSAAAARRTEITSIEGALIALGVDPVRRMIQYAIAGSLADSPQPELVELVSHSAFTGLVVHDLDKDDAGAGFVAGLITAASRLLGTDPETYLQQVSLGPVVVDGIRQRTGPVGQALNIIDAYAQEAPLPPGMTLERVARLQGQADVETAGALDMGKPNGSTRGLPPVRQPPRKPLPAEQLFGVPPAPEEVERARAWHRIARETLEHSFRTGCISREELITRYGADAAAALQSAIDQGHLAVCDEDGPPLVPMWQLATDGSILDGVAALVRNFPGDSMALTQWVLTPCDELDGQVPLSLLAQGRSEVVVDQVKRWDRW